MDYQKFKRIIAGLWVVAIAACIVKDVQEGKMKTLLVPIEVTDAQYLALDKSAKTDAHDEAQMVASAAVTSHANAVLAEIERMSRDINRTDEMLAEAEREVQESKEIVQEVEDEMPRTHGFVNAEIADVEAAVLYEEMRAEENIGQLTASGGVFMGPSGKETYYALPMGGVLQTMRGLGYSEEEYPYWVREDGCKMLGPYIMCAANLNLRPFGTILDTSRGEAIVCDTGAFAADNPTQIDLAVTWGE